MQPSRRYDCDASVFAHARVHERSSFLFSQEMDDAITLVRLQEQLEREHGPGYIGSTVSATIRKLIRAKQSGKVAKLRKDFRVPDKRLVGIGGIWEIPIHPCASPSVDSGG